MPSTMDAARPLYRVESKRGERLDLTTPASRAAAAVAAVQNGTAVRLLEQTTEYVAARKQFGRPVGSFQAVKHKLATVHVAIEDSRPAAWHAAYAFANNDPAGSIAPTSFS